MRQGLDPWRGAAGLTLAVVCGLLLGACDNREARLDRAETVTRAAIDQVTGAAVDAQADAEARMARAPTEARALAGELETELRMRPEARQARFAVGSIIAKPRDLPDLPGPEDSLAMQAPSLARDMAPRFPGSDEATGEAEARPTLDEGTLRALNQGRLQRLQPNREVLEALPEVELGEVQAPTDAGQGEEDTADSQTDRPVQLPPGARERLKLSRRAVVTPRAIEVQTRARSRMLETMSEFGLSGQVQVTRTGAMVVQIGEDGGDPTQFTAQGAGRPDLPQLALVSRIDCPDRPDQTVLRRNKVLATECVLKRLRDSGEFEYVEKDFIFDHQFARRPPGPASGPATVTPNDPLWALQWHFRNNGEGEDEAPGGSGFVDFWSRQASQGSSDVVVAVVDTGLKLDHPDFRDSPNIAPGWDMVSDPRMGNDGDGRDPDPNDPGDLCDPSDPTADNSFHGSHVAGTIGAAASNNGAGVAAGAWNVTLVPVRALGKCGGRLTDINDAIRWAGGLVPAFDEDGNEVWNDNPADIINLSIGLFEFCPASLQEAIDAVTERGVVVVSAAGNARVSTRYYSPGGCENVLTVAAGDFRGQITPYSNYGDAVDVLAPGGDLSRDDNGDGRPDGVLSTKPARNCYDPVTGKSVSDCHYAFEQGTSMAAPHVSAALALIKARDPGLSGTALRDRLLAALEPRSPSQCAGPCDQYQGYDPLPGSPDLCARPCGGGLLNLENLDFSAESTSDD